MALTDGLQIIILDLEGLIAEAFSVFSFLLFHF